jgi:hypothetical protein
VKRLLLLCVALVLAQAALAGHGIEHAFQDHAESCVECLSLPGMQALPALPPHLPPPATAPTPAVVAVPPAPTFALHPAFRSRAPPAIQSC